MYSESIMFKIKKKNLRWFTATNYRHIIWITPVDFFIYLHTPYLKSHSVGFLGEIAGYISKRKFGKYLGKHVIKKNGIYVNIYNNIINCLHVFECQNAKNAKNCQLIITQQRAVSKNNPPPIW